MPLLVSEPSLLLLFVAAMRAARAGVARMPLRFSSLRRRLLLE